MSAEISFCSRPSTSYEPRLVGAALENLGNTCFLNAVLQCLTHTVPLVEKIVDYEYSSCCCGEKDGFCSFSALKDHIKQCLVSSQYFISPTDIAMNLSKISPCLQLGQQEDAHEFLQTLLDTVHACCRNHAIKDCSSTTDEDSIIRQVFGGCLRSRLRCCSCGHWSDSYETILDLSLEIDSANNIRDALTSFTRVEKIEDDVKLTCDGCNCQVSMVKQFKLHQAPQVLALHLKRFENHGFFSSKISKHVEYTLELDLKQYLVSPSEELKYDLYAVVVHLGSSNSGHYFSFIRSSENAWHQMDDTQVTRVSEEEVLDQRAYILFYTKKGSCWFSSLLEAERIRHLEMIAHSSPTSVLDYVDSDLRLNSVQESHCSTSGTTSDKHESSRQYSHASSINPPIDLAPPCMDRSHGKVIKDRFLTQPSLRIHDRVLVKPVSVHSPVQSMRQPISDEHVIDVFEFEPLEDEKEVNLQGVQVPEANKSSLARPDHDIKGERMTESFSRSISGMPRKRREAILACLNDSQNKSSRKHRRSNSMRYT